MKYTTSIVKICTRSSPHLGVGSKHSAYGTRGMMEIKICCHKTLILKNSLLRIFVPPHHYPLCFNFIVLQCEKTALIIFIIGLHTSLRDIFQDW